MIDRGSGTPVVLIPGLQGRWEWMASAVDALAERCRLITFSLADEPDSGFAFDESRGLENYVSQIRDALDRARVEKAVLVGVSFGGPIAVEFAARHPERVLGLVLASALPLGWVPDARARFYMRAPRLLSPLFYLTSPLRVLPELLSSLSLRAWPRFLASLCRNLVRAALSPTRMARRLRWIGSFRFRDVSSLGVPVLIVTGDDRLDRIVRPELTRRYLTVFANATCVTIPGTGHLGSVTRPALFADAVCGFVSRIAAADETRLTA